MTVTDLSLISRYLYAHSITDRWDRSCVCTAALNRTSSSASSGAELQRSKYYIPLPAVFRISASESDTRSYAVADRPRDTSRYFGLLIFITRCRMYTTFYIAVMTASHQRKHYQARLFLPRLDIVLSVYGHALPVPISICD